MNMIVFLTSELSCTYFRSQ